MDLNFQKYQGAGNDFIIIDNRNRHYDHLNVAQLCHPKFGIGADGLMLLQNLEGYDFEMVYYNSDGNVSTMCGNGGRCIVDFAKGLGLFEASTVFKAIDGRHDANWTKEIVELQMQNVQQVSVLANAYELNTGSPHYVAFEENVSAIDLVPTARAIRYNDIYKSEGINVNFVEVLGPNSLKVRTYERGVEDETLSCGTGVTACAIAYSLLSGLADGAHTIAISTPGGQLKVKYELHNGQYTQVWLIGPAKMVFEGHIEI